MTKIMDSKVDSKVDSKKLSAKRTLVSAGCKNLEKKPIDCHVLWTFCWRTAPSATFEGVIITTDVSSTSRV